MFNEENVGRMLDEYRKTFDSIIEGIRTYVRAGYTGDVPLHLVARWCRILEMHDNHARLYSRSDADTALLLFLSYMNGTVDGLAQRSRS